MLFDSSLTKLWSLSSQKLLDWYQDQPPLPWRESLQPYGVWISEVMLQQTTVPTVKGYYQKFLDTFPTLQDLAAASLDQVLTVWQGLGYYRRAHHLHRCAQILVQNYKGQFPQDIKTLRSLPGFGEYTTAAVASICFQKPHLAVDGNIRRVLTRYGGKEASDHQLRSTWSTLLDSQAGAINQALMDIGRTLCRPQKVQCSLCPLQNECQNPMWRPKSRTSTKQNRWGHVFLIPDPQGRMAVRHNHRRSLLKGMVGFPTTLWLADSSTYQTPPCAQFYHKLPIPITHIFTHVFLTLHVWIRRRPIKSVSSTYTWIAYDERQSYPFSSLMKKLFVHWQDQISSTP
mgnify:CR=1 FL=1